MVSSQTSLTNGNRNSLSCGNHNTEMAASFNQPQQKWTEVILLQKFVEETEACGHFPKLQNHLGIMYYKCNDFKSAHDSFRKALTAAAPSAIDYNFQAITFQNIGTTLWKLEQFEKALTCFLNSLVIRLQQGTMIDIAQSYQNLGLALFLVDKFNEAMVELDQAYAIYYAHARELQHSNHNGSNTTTVLDVAYRIRFMGSVIAQQGAKLQQI